MRDLSAPRFMFYSHDGFGLGHYRRNVVLSRAIADLCPEASVLLACSADGMETFSLPSRVDVLRLPGILKLENGHYVGRRLPLESSKLVSMRSALLASAVEQFRPDVVLADKHPVGIHEELLPALQVLREQGGRAALGLRDVLDDSSETTQEWRAQGLAKRVAEFHELVLIYGTREMLNPLLPGLLPKGIGTRVHFCGYVIGASPGSTSPPPDLAKGDRRPFVLASAGGGGDGLPVLEAFIEASRGAEWRGALVAGPQMEGPWWARLEARAAEAGVLAYRSVHQMHRWFPYADALVCMGGYNTLLEAVTSGTPTVCVPRTRPRREQLIRAQAFAAKGLLTLVDPDSLSGAGLAAAIEGALGIPRLLMAEKVRATLDLGGAGRAASLLLDLAGEPRATAERSAELSAR